MSNPTGFIVLWAVSALLSIGFVAVIVWAIVRLVLKFT